MFRVVVIKTLFPISCVFNRVARRMSLVEQEPLTLPKHLSPIPFLCVVRIGQCLVFCVVFCGSFFVLFLFWPLYRLSFFDLRFLFSSFLASSNFFLKCQILIDWFITQVTSSSYIHDGNMFTSLQAINNVGQTYNLIKIISLITSLFWYVENKDPAQMVMWYLKKYKKNWPCVFSLIE